MANDHVAALVNEYLNSMPDDESLVIMSLGTFTRNELRQHFKDGTEAGARLVMMVRDGESFNLNEVAGDKAMTNEENDQLWQETRNAAYRRLVCRHCGKSITQMSTTGLWCHAITGRADAPIQCENGKTNAEVKSGTSNAAQAPPERVWIGIGERVGMRFYTLQPNQDTDVEYVRASKGNAKNGTAMTKGEVENATRRALNILDEWNDVAGVVLKNTSYYYELQGVVEDAVNCGAQAALGVHETLDSEK